jgi:hypothetical protein
MRLGRSSRSALAAATLSAVLVLSTLPVSAGLVRFIDGEVQLTAGEGPASRFPLAFPASGGHSARSDSSFAGETRVLYDLRETHGGATFEVSQDNSGDTHSTFTLTFNTATELQFHFYAEPRPYAFSAQFDDVVADAFYDPSAESPSDTYRGTLVHIDGVTDQPDGFEGRTFDGELEPGTHTLTVRSNGAVDRQTIVDGGGLVRLTLDAGAAPGPLPVPLPPAAWPAIVTLLVVAAVRLVMKSTQ